jgi:hypothetical protein
MLLLAMAYALRDCFEQAWACYESALALAAGEGDRVGLVGERIAYMQGEFGSAGELGRLVLMVVAGGQAAIDTLTGLIHSHPLLK